MSRSTVIKARNAVSIVGKIIRVIIIIALILVLLYIQNNLLLTKTYVFLDENIPKTFVGYKIVQVSDLANSNLNILNKINKANPDIVIFTGGYVDNSGSYKNSVNTINKVASKYKTFYTLSDYDFSYKDNIISSINTAIYLGNTRYELVAPSISYNDFVSKYIEEQYVKEASNDPNSTSHKYLEYTNFKLNEDANAHIELSGLEIEDPNINFVDRIVETISLDDDSFRLMSCNQSQYFSKINIMDIDLILSGNTFGVDRFNNGITKGLYSESATTMSVSGGIGKNIDGVKRIFNFPEITIITLSDGTINTNDSGTNFLIKKGIGDDNRFEADTGFKNYLHSNEEKAKAEE